MEHFFKACEERDKPFLFVSYSHDDSAEVQSLLQDLDRNHYRFWYDEGVKSGKEWADEVGWRIAHCAQFLVILSARAAASERVIDEINMAKTHHRDFCLVFLEPVKLNYGLEMQIGSKYGIAKYRYSQQAFQERFFGALKMELRSTETILKDGGALASLKEHYTLLDPIGSGGVAEVMLARAKRTGANVAVKRAMIDNSDIGHLVQSVMEQERQALMHLAGCQHVPMLIDWFQDEDSIYLVEQYVPGISLAAEKKDYSCEDIMQLAAELLNHLRIFEKRQTLYLDMKPANVIRDRDGNLWIVDFGSARIPGSEARQQVTPGFSAPEQFRAVGGKIGAHTDLYALGRTLLYLLLRNSISSQAFKEFSAQPHSLRYFRPDLPADLEFILETMTAERPEDRFSTAEAALAALESCHNHPADQNSVLYWRSEHKIQQYKDFISRARPDPLNSSTKSTGMETVLLGGYSHMHQNQQWDITEEERFDTVFGEFKQS